MRSLLLGSLALAALMAGCDTRPTCEVICGNEVRCGFSDEASCPGNCSARIATSTMDCRVATDAYNRCWAAQDTCPASRDAGVTGCNAERDRMSLACIGGI